MVSIEDDWESRRTHQPERERVDLASRLTTLAGLVAAVPVPAPGIARSRRGACAWKV